MTENQGLSLRGAFLHDTQTAELLQEATLIERARGGLSERLPFRIAPPFCPLPPDRPSFLAPEGNRSPDRLEILAPIAREGWIVRPLRPLNGRAEIAADTGFGGLTRQDGLPPIPELPAILFGYWGPEAEAILAEAITSAEGKLFRDFSVRVWYHAEIRLEYSFDTPGIRSLSWTIGKPAWIKAER